LLLSSYTNNVCSFIIFEENVQSFCTKYWKSHVDKVRINRQTIFSNFSATWLLQMITKWLTRIIDEQYQMITKNQMIMYREEWSQNSMITRWSWEDHEMILILFRKEWSSIDPEQWSNNHNFRMIMFHWFNF
jgi:hypothetical protein